MLEDAAAPVIVELVAFLWLRGWLSGRASLGDLDALEELCGIDPIAAELATTIKEQTT